jgi:hypothetical protein
VSAFESLETRAARVREHLLSTAEALDHRGQVVDETARHPEDSGGSSTRLASSDELARDASPDGAEVDTPERERLEQRAERVREHLTESAEELERKARQRLMPIAVAAGVLVVLHTAAFVWMFYRTVRAARHPRWFD